MFLENVPRGFALAAAIFLSACAGGGDPVTIEVDLPAPVLRHAQQAASTTAVTVTTVTPAGTTQQTNPIAVVTEPKIRHLVIHAHNRIWPAYLQATDKLVLDYITDQYSALNAADAVAIVEKQCRIYTKDTRPNDLVAVLIGTTVYGASEFPFMVAGSSVFRGAKVLQYGAYGSASEAGGGFGNGIISLGGKLYTFQNCGRGIFERAKDFGIVILDQSPY